MDKVQLPSASGTMKNKSRRSGGRKIAKVNSLLTKRPHLQEDEASQMQDDCTKELREWLKTQNHLKNVRTDDPFLIRFLRFQKFRLPETKVVLDKYVQMRDQHREWFHGLDIRDPHLRELMTCGYIFVLPQRDKNGRRVVFSKPSTLDTNKYNGLDLMRAHLLTYETLLCEEENQKRGLTYVFDERDVGWNHIAIFSPSEISKALKCCEKALPIRHLEMHCVGLPWALNLVLQFAKSLMSQKLRDRIFTHSNFENGGNKVPLDLLPSEISDKSELSMKQMIDLWLEEVEARRDEVLDLEKMSYGQANSGQESTRTIVRNDHSVLDVMISVRKMESVQLTD